MLILQSLSLINDFYTLIVLIVSFFDREKRLEVVNLLPHFKIKIFF